MTRVLGVDLGSVRVGLAVSDPDGILASPLDVVARDAATDAIADQVRELEIGEIVVGIPFRMDGTSGPAADEAEAFAVQLGVLTGLPVSRFDERLSSKEAEKAMRAAGVSSRGQRGVLDKVAAALVLQAFLDTRRTR